MHIVDTADWERFANLPDLPGLNAVEVRAARPDQLLLAVDDEGRDVARCALWWRSTPLYQEAPAGLIGDYAARDQEIGAQLLQVASEWLIAQGAVWVIGPMNGSTWRRYRLVTAPGDDPSFFLEPHNPPDWPNHFRTAGFFAAEHYYSAVADDLSLTDPRLERLADQMAEVGIVVRPLRSDEFEPALVRIHGLSLEAFRANTLFSPIPLADFLTLYRPIAGVVQPKLVWLAERGDELIGFLFALPDQAEAARGSVQTFIIKTLAVRPDFAGKGLAALMVGRCLEAARAMGFRRVVHALMHDANRSSKMSAHTGRVIRRYALFARKADAVQ